MTRRSASALTIVLTAALAVDGEFISARQNQPGVTAQAGGSDLAEAERLQQEAERHIEARQYKDAAPKLEEALRIRKQRLGESHPDVATSIGSLGAVAYYLGDYARAESLVAEALKIREATLGPNHALVAESLSDLASMYLVRGDYVRPEPLFLRALAIHDSAPAGAAATEARTLTAGVLNNLALLYQRRGDFERAESHYLRVIAIREAARGADDPSVAEAAANLGGVYYSSARYPKAIETLTRALRIQERNLPADHPALATSSFNLAAVYLDQGDYAPAEVLFQRALTIDEKAVDPQHPRLAIRLLGLAEVLRLKGEYARAEPLYERAMTIRDRALGQGHPLFAETVIGRSLLRYAGGDLMSAVDLLERGAALREDTVALVLTTGTESAKRLYLRTLDDESEIALTLHLRDAPTAPRAAALALTHVVQRKGRSIDATTDHMAALRSRLNGDDRELLGRRAQAQGQLANLVLRGVSTDEQRKTVSALRAEIQQIEQSISSRSSEFRGVQRTTLTDIQAALPADAVLLEFVAYRPFLITNPRRTAFAPPHYAVYALRREGIVGSADLGEVAVVDREVERLRVALSTANGRDVPQAAQALYRRVVAPVKLAIGDAPRLVISPDGALNLIPFAAVMSDEGRYLVENHAISYVTSGRDLARLRRPGDTVAAAGPPVVIANPSFEGLRAPTALAAVASGAPGQAPPSETLTFAPLPGTGEEAVAIATLLTDARVFTGAAATEAALKQVNAPAILHIATHGFFLGAATSSQAAVRGLTAAPAQGGPPAGAGEDALLMSGLAMAGANQRWSGEGEDGILTALEATSLDLRGTRLVVLSACETGVGDARRGEGVYGLRRALVLAGSESQVMSLWQVSDTATRDLMIAYYRRLRAGEGRADALRRVQLDMLRTDPARAHPFYWASFIQSGDWRPAFN